MKSIQTIILDFKSLKKLFDYGLKMLYRCMNISETAKTKMISNLKSKGISAKFIPTTIINEHPERVY